MDLRASVAGVAAERHPLQPPSPHADSESASPHAADTDFWARVPPPVVAPFEQARCVAWRLTAARRLRRAPWRAQLSGLALLRATARRGAWRAVVDVAKKARAPRCAPALQWLTSQATAGADHAGPVAHRGARLVFRSCSARAQR
jgi:hypothetical protein